MWKRGGVRCEKKSGVERESSQKGSKMFKLSSPRGDISITHRREGEQHQPTGEWIWFSVSPFLGSAVFTFPSLKCCFLPTLALPFLKWCNMGGGVA